MNLKIGDVVVFKRTIYHIEGIFVVKEIYKWDYILLSPNPGVDKRIISWVHSSELDFAFSDFERFYNSVLNENR